MRTDFLHHKRDEPVVNVDTAPDCHDTADVGVVHPHGARVPPSLEGRVHSHQHLGTLHQLHLGLRALEEKRSGTRM